MAAYKKKEFPPGFTSRTLYADYLGCSHVAVLNAIKEGRITSKALDGKLINIEIANTEFGNYYLLKNKKTAQALPTTPTAVDKPYKSYEGFETPAEPASKAATGISNWNGGEVPKNIDYAEALRIGQIIASESQRLKNEEIKGTLVKKEDINRQLSIAAITIRKELELIPSQVIDNIRGANSRSEAIIVLEDAITKALTNMGHAINTAIERES